MSDSDQALFLRSDILDNLNNVPVGREPWTTTCDIPELSEVVHDIVGQSSYQPHPDHTSPLYTALEGDWQDITAADMFLGGSPDVVVARAVQVDRDVIFNALPGTYNPITEFQQCFHNPNPISHDLVELFVSDGGLYFHTGHLFYTHKNARPQITYKHERFVSNLALKDSLSLPTAVIKQVSNTVDILNALHCGIYQGRINHEWVCRQPAFILRELYGYLAECGGFGEDEDDGSLMLESPTMGFMFEEVFDGSGALPLKRHLFGYPGHLPLEWVEHDQAHVNLKECLDFQALAENFSQADLVVSLLVRVKDNTAYFVTFDDDKQVTFAFENDEDVAVLELPEMVEGSRVTITYNRATHDLFVGFDAQRFNVEASIVGIKLAATEGVVHTSNDW